MEGKREKEKGKGNGKKKETTGGGLGGAAPIALGQTRKGFQFSL